MNKDKGRSTGSTETNSADPRSEQQETPPSSSGGMWVAFIMFGLLALIIVVEMLRSKG